VGARACGLVVTVLLTASGGDRREEGEGGEEGGGGRTKGGKGGGPLLGVGDGKCMCAMCACQMQALPSHWLTLLESRK
jgi:hypothetical protein